MTGKTSSLVYIFVTRFKTHQFNPVKDVIKRLIINLEGEGYKASEAKIVRHTTYNFLIPTPSPLFPQLLFHYIDKIF